MLNMVPSFSINDAVNGAPAYVKRFGELKSSDFLNFIKASYFFNLIANQFGISSIFSPCSKHGIHREGVIFSVSHSSFFCRILNILLRSSKPKVFGIDTSPVIARMANMKSGSYLFAHQEKTKSWRVFKFSHKPEGSISTFKFSGLPNPASVVAARFVNLFPKPFFHGFESLIKSGFHKQETPAKSEVKSAQWGGNVINGCKFLVSLVFSATSRPETAWSKSPFLSNEIHV